MTQSFSSGNGLVASDITVDGVQGKKIDALDYKNLPPDYNGPMVCVDSNKTAYSIGSSSNFYSYDYSDFAKQYDFDSFNRIVSSFKFIK